MAGKVMISARALVLSSFECSLMRSVKSYDAAVTEATWMINRKHWKIVYHHSGRVDLLEVWLELKKTRQKGYL